MERQPISQFYHMRLKKNSKLILIHRLNFLTESEEPSCSCGNANKDLSELSYQEVLFAQPYTVDFF